MSNKCSEWTINRISKMPVNPLTGRKIKPNGPTFKKLDKLCLNQGSVGEEKTFKVLQFLDRSDEVSANMKKFEMVIENENKEKKYVFKITMDPVKSENDKDLLELVFDKFYDSFR
jgi:hypothetical protein